MQPTDISVPDYFHKVVDCQWACPAHTPVPEYIRLIAARRYADAWAINWRTNVFPGILGRTCDRPCEPACRRGRVEKDPVAICRLKRVAADNKGDITRYLPQIPREKNGRRVALVGAGPASLTVARDLLPLGYRCVMFDGDAKGGGMIRTQIPRFRLPETVTDEEVDRILAMGVETRFGHPVDSLKALLEEGWDAVFVGCGAPRGRDLDLPGRRAAAAHIQIGIDWLAGVSFGHIDRIGRRVVILGGGNTAMDCCRSSRRLGGEEVTVIVRSGFDEMKASTWEKEDAMHEGIPILNWLVPKEFTHERGRLTGVRFEPVKADHDAQGRRTLVPTGAPDTHIACDDVLIAVGQENAFPWIERDIGIAFDRWDMPKVDPRTMQSSLPRVFFGGDAAFGPKNIIWAVAHGRDAAISIDKLCHGEDVALRPPPGVTLVSQKMGIHEWSYDNDISNDLRFRVPLRDTAVALADIRVEVELGYDQKLGLSRGRTLPQLRRADRFRRPALHRMRRLRRHLPDGLHHLHRRRQRGRVARPADGAGPEPRPGPLYRRPAEDRADHGQGRRRLPALRVVCRALPDRRLGHAQVPLRADAGRRRLPPPLNSQPLTEGAMDAHRTQGDRTFASPASIRNSPRGMNVDGSSRPSIKRVNDFVVKFANVNGSGSASANGLFAKSVLRMGVPASSRNIFPSNIQGLPTWYEVRISEAGHLGRRGGVDMMVAMNPQTWDEDVAEIEPGGYLFYDSTKPMPPAKFRADITVIGAPLTEICNRTYDDVRQRQLFKNIIYLGALSALLDMDAAAVETLIGEQFRGKKSLIRPNLHALKLGREWALAECDCPIGLRLRRADAVGDRIFITGNEAAALGAVYGGATVAAWYPITPSSSLAEAFAGHCRRYRTDPESKKRRYAILQAEDELASIGMVVGAAWNGARAFTATSGPAFR